MKRDPKSEISHQPGADFIHEKDGQTTTVHSKGPVGSEIQKAQNHVPDLERQGESIGNKLFKQFIISTRRDSEKYTRPSSINDNILIVDLCDVPQAEKADMKSHIDKGFLDAYNDWVNKVNNNNIPQVDINSIN